MLEKICFGNTDECWLNAISVCGAIQKSFPKVSARLNCANIGNSDGTEGVVIEVTGAPTAIADVMAWVENHQ